MEIKRPIFSKLVMGRDEWSGEVTLTPEELRRGDSYTINKRRIHIYANRFGKSLIPSEWRNDGVTVYAFHSDNDNVHYEFLV
jgi:hypothetical protein